MRAIFFQDAPRSVDHAGQSNPPSATFFLTGGSSESQGASQFVQAKGDI